MGKLYGIGVGPGDPELLTLKAYKILNQADVIFCPEKKKGAGSFAFDIIKEHNMRLVAHVVKKYQCQDYDTEDLLSAGTIGLIKAVNTFDVDKGSRLATYAARCVENEILMLLRAGKKRAKEVSLFEPIGTDKDGETVSLVDVIEMENPKTIDQLILDQDIKELYQAFDQKLTENEKQVISMRYGLFKGKEHTQREVAGVLGISRSYVSRIEKKAIGKLREEFEKIQ